MAQVQRGEGAPPPAQAPHGRLAPSARDAADAASTQTARPGPLATELLRLQDLAGNGAVAALLTPVVQRQRRPRAPHSGSRRGRVELLGVSVIAQAHDLFVQEGPTCSAASLVSELSVRDEDSRDPQHRVISAAMANVRAYVRANRARSIQRLVRFLSNGHFRLGERPTDAQLRAEADALFDRRVLDNLAEGGQPITSRQPALLALSQAMFFAFMTEDGDVPSTAEVAAMLVALGLPQRAGGSVDNVTFSTFDEIWNNLLMLRLTPGEAVRVVWWTRSRSGGPVRHAFVIGQRASGNFYLADQGPAGGYRQESGSLDGLRALVVDDIRSGAYWLWPRNPVPGSQGEANYIPAPPR